ncbi:hypothetical protein P6709_14400 [Jeotgalibacillus sp. ET6]|uniref:hypothetical protein n=1 Tax=Jeotgalibacillus sp. ET6 TaxID=3037260 RepID=UPI002418574A|nr:hypothetical protein [Jeotgalibacillus sp. ET6]MDG5472941.1 hypothetical protein [Jeotgalibacillus sp. ET6]
MNEDRSAWNDQNKNVKNNKSKAPFKAFLIVLSLCGITIVSFFFYEKWLNSQVIEWKTQGESDAFNHKWDEAEELLQQAYETRPGVEGVEASLEAVKDAKEFERRVERLSSHLDEEEIEKAEIEMNKMIEKMEASQNELYFLYKDKLIELRDKSVVLGIQNDIEHPLSMQALAGKLLEISDMESDAAVQVKSRIKEKISKAAIAEAREKMESYRFSEALNIVEIGLGYTSDHEDLLTFKSEIKEARLAYQTEEYDRLQEAMKEAEREDHFNRTESVSIKEWDVITSEPGTIELMGKVENRGTRQIKDIRLTWGVFNAKDELVTESTVSVTPSNLMVNEEGEFKDSIKLEGEELNAEIMNITWDVE